MNRTVAFYSDVARAINGYHMTDNPKTKEVNENIIKNLEALLPVNEFIEARKIDIQRSTGQRLVILVRYKNVHEYKSYNSITGHQLIITPCLMNGFNIRLTGLDRRGSKEKIEKLFTNFIE